MTPRPSIDSLIKHLRRCRTIRDESVNLRGADPAAINGLAEATGLRIPPPLRAWLSHVNGVELPGCHFYPTHHIAEDFHRYPEYVAASLLPIAGDGCGDHYLAAIRKNEIDPPIVFVDAEIGRDTVSYIAASNLYTFIEFFLTYALDPDGSRWPGNSGYVLAHDPDIASFGYPLPWEG